MRTLDEVISALAERFDAEELVDMLEISNEQLLTRFDDIVEQNMDWIQEELFDESE